MTNKTIFYVAEAISENYDIDIKQAEGIVANSFFPEMLEKMTDFVQHYDAEYWAKEIMDDVSVR